MVAHPAGYSYATGPNYTRFICLDCDITFTTSKPIMNAACPLCGERNCWDANIHSSGVNQPEVKPEPKLAQKPRGVDSMILNDRTKELRDNFEKAVNQSGIDNELNTADYVLADYLLDCLYTYKRAVARRDLHNNDE